MLGQHENRLLELVFPKPCIFIHRIERLWRDVRVIVTNKYSAILLCLEEDGLLDISSTDDLFCVHYIILPRLQMDLGIFTEGWNHHPLSSERNQCPEQLWQLGLMQTNIDQPESPEVLILFQY